MKAARSAYSMADIIPFFKVFNIPFEANALIKPRKYLFNTLRNIFRVSTFQQLFPKGGRVADTLKVKQTSHANHTMRGLRYPQLILERLGFPLALTQTLQVLASSCLPRQIFNSSSKLLTRFEKPAKEFASDA